MQQGQQGQGAAAAAPDLGWCWCCLRCWYWTCVARSCQASCCCSASLAQQCHPPTRQSPPHSSSLTPHPTLLPACLLLHPSPALPGRLPAGAMVLPAGRSGRHWRCSAAAPLPPQRTSLTTPQSQVGEGLGCAVVGGWVGGWVPCHHRGQASAPLRHSHRRMKGWGVL